MRGVGWTWSGLKESGALLIFFGVWIPMEFACEGTYLAMDANNEQRDRNISIVFLAAKLG
jgi:hypothetical protein